MQLPHPDSNQKFDRVQGDYGYRNVLGQEETVHIPTGQSNMAFWKPETVANSEGCQHEFFIEDIGKREMRCKNYSCNLGFTFHAKDIIEDQTGTYVILKDVKHKINL